jgi:Rrf2 family transcriptional regulator, cysteine metabolism repressor
VFNISQKCQYGLRAVFELARRPTGKPRKIGDIAEAQAIPPRFLESILNTLKQAGIVESRRGASGGYLLAIPPAELTAAKVIAVLDGPVQPVKCIAAGGSDCPLRGKCTFVDMWRKAGSAMENVFEATTFQTLLDREPSVAAGPPTEFDI